MLSIIEVVSGGDVSIAAFEENGAAINSANDEISLNGLSTEQAKTKINLWLKGKNIGMPTVQFKLRDWLFARQRYWGEPIPMIHFEDGTMKPLREEDPSTRTCARTASGISQRE